MAQQMQPPRPPQMDEQTRRVELLCHAAQLVLESGGETYRVEETVRRMAKGLGMEEINVVAFPTSIFVETQGRACLRRISHRGTNMRRLVMTNDISRQTEHGELSLSQAERALDAVSRDPGIRQDLAIPACALACGSFSLLVGGGLHAFLIAFVIGLIVQAAQPLFSGTTTGALLSNFCGGLFTALLAQATQLALPGLEVNAVIIGGIMPFLSGLLMTTAVRDTMYGDLVSGVARAVEALLLAAAVASGVYVGLKLVAAMGGIAL